MGSLRAADKLAAGGELMKAHALYETAANRNVPGAYERLCHTRHLLGRHAEALSCCETALQLHPGNSFLLSLDGQVALELGRIERAIESYKRASTQNPRDGDLSNNLGIALSAAGRYADAAARLRQAVQLLPQSAAAYTELGRALDATGMVDGAIDAHAMASKLSPAAKGTHVDLANALLAAQRPAEAATAYEHALRLAPATVDRSLSVAHFGLGRAALSVGNPCGALGSFTTATALTPVDADFWHQRGVAARRCSERGAEAKHAWREALKLAPRRTDSLSMLRLHGYRTPMAVAHTVSVSAAGEALIAPTASEVRPLPLGSALHNFTVRAYERTDDTEAWRRHASTILQRHGALLVLGAVPGGLAHVLGTHLRASSSGQEGRRSFDSTNTTLAREGRRHQAISLRAKVVSDALSALALALQPVIVEELAAGEASIHGPRDSSATLRILESGLLTSSPGALAQPVHTDTAREPAEGRVFKVQIATTHIESVSGPIEVVPGSAHAPSQALNDVGLGASPTSAQDAPLIPVAPMPPGAAFVYDTRMWHRGGANRSDRDRPVYYLALMMPSSLPPAGLPYTIEPSDVGCFELGPEGIRVAKQTSTKATRRCSKDVAW